MPKQIQIDMDLFKKIIEYFYGEKEEDLELEIRRGLQQKVDKLIAHQLFTQYKKAPSGSEEREKFRNEYLNRIGVFKDFRTQKEWHEEEPPDDI